jgi:hypothetical protein
MLRFLLLFEKLLLKNPGESEYTDETVSTESVYERGHPTGRRGIDSADILSFGIGGRGDVDGSLPSSMVNCEV